MALQILTLQDGRTLEVDAPLGATKEELAEAANRELALSVGDRRRMLEERERRTARERYERAIEAAEEAELAARESKRGAFGRGIDIGTDRIAQATGSALEGIGSLLGLEGLEEYGAEVALENEADAQRKARFQTRFDDIEGIGDFGSYLTGIAAESAPQMGATLTGAAIGTAFAPGIGTAIGTAIGGIAASLPFFYGMNRERQKDAIEQGLKTEVDEGAAILGALPQSALDAIIGRVFVGGLGLTNRAISGGGIFTRGVKGAAVGSIVEAPTELGQQVIERLQAGLPLDDEEAIAEYREAAIAGGLLGGAVRGTASVVGGDVAAREDAAERARLEAIPKLPEDAPSGRQGELFEVDEDAQIEADIDRAETAEIEAMIAEDEAAETAAEIKRETTQRDMFDELETAEIEAEIDAEETAEVEAMVAEDEAAAAEAERLRKRSERETRIGIAADARPVTKESEIARRRILQDVVENQPTRQLNTLQKRFSRALEAAGVTDSQPTAAENAAMERVIDIARAEPEPLEALPAESDVTEMEARIPERRTATEISDTTELRQTSLEGLGRRRQRAQPEPEPTTEPRLVTEEDLTTAGFKKNAAIRKRVIGKDLNDAGVRADLTETANQFREPKVKEGVTRLLEGVPSEQRGLFDPPDPIAPVTTPPTEQPAAPVETPTKKKRKPSALVKRTRDKIKMRTLGQPTVSQPDAETGEITVTFNDGETRTMQIEDGLYVATDRPDPQGRILGETPKQAVAALEKQRKGPELQKKASKLIGKTKTKRKAPKRPKLQPRKGPTEEEIRVEKNRRKKARTTKFKELKNSGIETKEAQRIAKEEFPDVTIGTLESKVGSEADGYALSEELAEGRTEKEIIEESNRLLKETKGGTLVNALENVRKNKNNAFEGLLAGKLINLIKRMENAGMTFDYEVFELKGNIEANGTRGKAIFQKARQGQVKVAVARTKDPLAEHNGLMHKTILHEAVHAVTYLSLHSANKKFIEGTKLGKDRSDLIALFNDVVKYGNDEIKKAVADDTIDSVHPALRAYYKNENNSLRNPDELLAWVLTDKTMQDYLDTIPYNTRTGEVGSGNVTMLDAIINALRKLLNLPPKDNTALNELLRLQHSLLDPVDADIETVVRATATDKDKNVAVLRSQVTDPGLIERNEADMRNTIDKAFKSVPILNSEGVNRVRKTLSDLTIPQVAKDFVLSIASLNGLEMIGKKYVPQLTEFRKLVLEEGGRLLELKQPIDTAINKISKFAKANKEKVIILNRLMPYSSLIGVDPSKPRSAYDGNAEKQAEWDAMHKGDWKNLGEDGRAIYKQVRNIYAALFDEVGAAVKSRLEATDLDPDARRNIYDELMNKLYKKATIDPFFPLLRAGEYRLEYNAVDPETGQLEYYTESFETDGAREDAIDQLNAIADKIKLKNLKPFEKIQDASYRKAPAGSFVNNVLGVLSKNKVDPKIEEEIIKLFLDTLPERSFAQSFRKREGFRGFIGDPRLLREETYPDHDMVKALRTRSASIARQIVRMEYGSKFQKLQQEIEEANKKISDPDKRSREIRKQIVREVQKRINFAKNPDVENWAKNLTTFGFAMTLGLNVSSVLVNFSQIPMVIAPHLAGTRGEDGELFGLKRTTSAIGEAVRLFRNAGITDENYKYVPFIKKRKAVMDMIGAEGKEKTEVDSAPSLDNYDFDSKDMPPEIKEYKVLVDVAKEQSQLNRSIIYDMLDLEEIDSVRGKIGAVSGFLFHHGERMTRQVALAASYRLMLDSMKRAGRKIDNAAMREAAEFAIYEVELTNGGTAAASAPRIGQRNIGKVAFLYKRYGVQMAELLISLIYNSVRGTKADKQAARLQGIGTLGGAFAVAGAQGLPLFGAVAIVYNLLKDDNDEDFDTIARKAIGEEFYGGLGNALLGVDVASRMGLSDLIFRDRLIEKNQPFIFDMAEILGGPVVGVALQIDRGYDKMFQQGEFVRGVEAMSPAAIRNALKTYRFYTEGVKTQRGDNIVKDLPAPLLVGQFLGFAPAEYTRQLAVNAQLKKLSKAGSSQRTNLLRKYYVAYRFGNFAETRKIMRDIAEFNKKFPSLRITPETIKKSMAQHMRTTKKIYSGVTLDPRMFNDLKQSAAEYDDTLTIWENLGL